MIAAWLDGSDATEILDMASVSLAREAARAAANAAGFGEDATGALAIVASELATNQLRHARLGHVAVRPLTRAGVPGVEIVAADAGPGIADVGAALAGKGGGGGSLGAGLAAVRRLSAEIDIDVRAGEGTCVWARVFADDVPPAASVGIYGVACAGERESGDDAYFTRRGGPLLVVVADGLGHGAPAREASRAAVETVRAAPERGLVAQLEQIHGALADTRGAVVGLARLDGESGEIAITGNITAQADRRSGVERFFGTTSVLGSRGASVRPKAPTAFHLARGELFLVFSDGVASRIRAADDPALLVEHPAVIAQRMVERFGKGHDDAIIAVLR